MRYTVVMMGLVALLIAGIGAGLLIGHGSLGGDSGGVFLSLRGCRLAAAALSGAALALGGVLVQGLFRNPLASPDLLGTTAGATLGGQTVLVAHALAASLLPASLLPEMLLPLGCLVGAALALAVLMLLAGRTTGLTTVLIIGFLITALVGSVSTLIVSLVREQWELVRALQGFGLGGVDGKGLAHVLLAAPLVIAGAVAAWGWGRPLDALLSGEEEAAALGVDVTAVRRWVLVWTAVLTSAAVAVGGGAVFVGLIVPHALRGVVGVGHRRLIPAAALGGAAFLVWCDDLARALPVSGEVPLTVITGLIGAPLFIVLLLRTQRAGVV